MTNKHIKVRRNFSISTKDKIKDIINTTPEIDDQTNKRTNKHTNKTKSSVIANSGGIYSDSKALKKSLGAKFLAGPRHGGQSPAAPKGNRNLGGDKCKSRYDDFFYSIANSKLLTILIVLTIFLIIVFFCIFKYFTQSIGLNDSSNSMVATFISLVGLPVGIILAFIVSNTWSNFSDAQIKENEEATELLVLYDLMDDYPNDEGTNVQLAIQDYTRFIIDEEFSLMEKGIQPQQGLEMLFNIGDLIYALDPIGAKEATLYSESIDIFQRILSLRIIRMGHVSTGLAPELWWVLILGVVIVIFMTFFLYSSHTYVHLIMVSMTGTALVALLFLIVALNFPYRGDFGLDSIPFQLALLNMIPKSD